MIKELQKRLILLYTFTTGIIVSLVAVAISLVSQMNLLKQIDADFQKHIMNISTKLQTDNSLSVSWLASTESSNGLIIHIEQNGKPLLYQSSWNTSENREYLIGKAKEQAALLDMDVSVPSVSSASISPVFTLTGLENDKYKGISFSYPSHAGSKSIILLYYISPALKLLNTQRLLFIAADILAVAALYLTVKSFVRKAVKPIQSSSRKQREFVAAASHELRSPLMAIQSSAQAIETVPEKTLQFTENINKECKRMGCLINDLLLLASFDSENWPVNFELLDPNMLLIDFYALYEPVCADKKVPFQLILPEAMLPEIRGDGERLFQILSILMDNALSYNKDSGEILLEAFMLKSQLTIKVIDHGCGIAEDKKELIFDRFYREDISRNDKQHFGLGLSIAKELISLHNGTIHVTDTPGGGSTFILKLPVPQYS